MKLKLPPPVDHAVMQLENCGFRGYLVGGCVRDFLLDKTPLDYDMTTDATPEEVKACFRDYRVVETGILHGTVTVIIQGFSIEITTHRIEGSYTDSRHPDEVLFSKDIEDDLARRDFTINALAYYPEKGLIDLFGGAEDIRSKIIRCVGDPQKRMEEDALRILRGLRFAAVLDFQLEEKTRAAIHKNCERLRDISAERIAVELTGLLCGKNMGKIFLEETRVLGVVVPEILPAEGFDQRNPHHCHDVLTHTIIAMENVPPLPRLRWAMLFHDLGKPEAFSLDEAGVGHFYGHSKISEGLARERLTALRIDKTTIDQVCKLIKYHDTPIVADERIVKRWLNRLSEPLFRDLLKIKRGDNLAQAYRDRLAELDKLEALLNKVIREQACFSLKDLAVKGDDLMALGIEKGPEIGRILNQLLEGVMDEAYENKKNVLIEKAKELQTC